MLKGINLSSNAENNKRIVKNIFDLIKLKSRHSRTLNIQKNVLLSFILKGISIGISLNKTIQAMEEHISMNQGRGAQ